jgi:protein TonB
MQLTPNGSPPALLISLALHVLAFVGAGIRSHRTASTQAAPRLEISIESEVAEVPLPAPAPEPSANEAPAPAPVGTAAVHHEPVAVHAVTATAPKVAPESAPPADAPATVANDMELPHFSIAASIKATPGGSLAEKSGAATAFEGAPAGDAPYTDDAVDVPARAVKKVSPRYPLQARSSGAEATVKLEIVLSSTGVVESVRALSHPGHGFEEEAIAAARRTPFTPAMKRGRAVPVRMAWTVEFQLQ